MLLLITFDQRQKMPPVKLTWFDGGKMPPRPEGLAPDFKLGDKDFRLPGLGSYMSVAVENGDKLAMIYAIVAMIAMIVFLDQVLWRPVVVWAQRFRIEETAQADTPHSWLLRLLRRSRLIRWVEHRRAMRKRNITKAEPPAARQKIVMPQVQSVFPWLGNGALALLILMVLWGTIRLVQFLAHVPGAEWWNLALAGEPTWTATLAEISSAVDAVNLIFEEGREAADCSHP